MIVEKMINILTIGWFFPVVFTIVGVFLVLFLSK